MKLLIFNASIVMIIILLFLVYYFKYSTNVEVYHYNVVDLEENLHKIAHSKKYDIHYIAAPIYNSVNEIVGDVFSQNVSNIFDDYRQITTTTTYKFNNGALVCNFFYSTDVNQHYVDGKIFSKPTFTSGKYLNKNVSIEVDGTDNTANQNRILKITY